MTWEYKILVVRDQIDPDRIGEEIVKAGLEGWEAVSMTPKYIVPAYLVLLKRPAPEKTDV